MPRSSSPEPASSHTGPIFTENLKNIFRPKYSTSFWETLEVVQKTPNLLRPSPRKSQNGCSQYMTECFGDAKWQGIIKTMSDGPQSDWSCGWVCKGRSNVPNQPKQSNYAGVKIFGNSPAFGYGENASIRTGLLLPGDLKWFRNHPTTSVFCVVHSHRISEVCVLTWIYPGLIAPEPLLEQHNG